ncbi:amino acid ABC transporter substrate-binding protein (PAAT family) [Lachnotalea glycerini]|uniref:Amino acid ABC transporter substrate-binding protein (PAAT family) n=1 Tax=Lachnotalea glycerini TaxID=1763509 RepID=A0A255I4N0_9FIRM|nr:transporter substrate-binding domain-containing protein [Lachnotalea glycerini]PXV93582.1 amino acid ABC transporter substrate-binding protein (PAAT family) [Lachnotalea glycerini]RDY32539.1 glutamine ABC transporter substrate-binding protein [Lachnotalea glycerini]
MKKFKNVILFMTTLALALTAACSGSKSNESAASEQNSQETTSDSNKYIIATDTVFAPFEFTDASNKFVGIDVELLDAIATDQGFEYELNSLGFDAALLAVEAGQADGVIAGMSITEERKAKYDFSDSYYESNVTMAVAIDSDISSYEDLSGKKVAVKTGTKGADFAKSIMEQYGFEITEFSDSPNMYQDVIVGNTVACFEDYPVMAYNIKQGAKLQMPGDIKESGSSYGFAVSKDKNSELLEMFNKGLANIKANGTYDEIIEKYTK